VNAQQRKIDRTEKSISAQLPDDIFRFDAKALDRAASFGLVPMQEGWIAGWLIGKLVKARMRSKMSGIGQKMRPDFNCSYSDGFVETDKVMELKPVDPILPAGSLLRLRTDLVKRGLIS
jgi:hypothetical protein